MFGLVRHKEYDAFREILVSMRKKQGVTQVELARRLGSGTTQSDVSKIERGERRLDVVEFIVFARALDIEPRKMFAAIERAVFKS